MTDQQIDEFLEMLAKSPTSARDMVRGLFAANEAKAAPASTQDEPFGYFRAEPFGWTDCAATDEGAIALYERPAAPAVPNVLKRGYGRLIQAAADLALQQFMPSDRLRLLSIEVSEGAKQMLAAAPAAPSQEPAVPGVEMPLSMNQFGRLVELTREHLSDNTFVYKATSKTGDTCHFGVESAAKAWAKGGTVEAIKVREFKLHTPPAAPSQPVTLTDTWLLEQFKHHPNWELSTSNDPECDPSVFWLVHEVKGGRNDREWFLIGEGESPRAAIIAALREKEALR